MEQNYFFTVCVCVKSFSPYSYKKSHTRKFIYIILFLPCFSLYRPLHLPLPPFPSPSLSYAYAPPPLSQPSLPRGINSITAANRRSRDFELLFHAGWEFVTVDPDPVLTGRANAEQLH